MLFSTWTFGLFIVAVLCIVRLVPGWTGRKLVLLLASYGFYATWNWPFTVLLVISTVVDFTVARRLAVTEPPSARKLLVLISLVVNLGILAVFKYADFALETVSGVASAVGRPVQFDTLDIILPLGISFYTFQTLSYTLDIYRRRYAPTDNVLDFALFVTFFPQLVAGPIVRADHFLPQCETPPEPQPGQWNTGLVLIVWGLFKKVAIADNLGLVADKVFAAPDQAGLVEAVVGTGAFAVQIYCDFSGYSQMAIGLALWLGFHLPDNFNHPYAAIGFSDFWRRWHISLSQWLRDYLYISLGGNRGGAAKTRRNLMLTMLLGGLWHGAAWNYVIWGGLHGLYLWLERGVLKALKLPRHFTPPGGLTGFAWAMATFGLVLITWVFFRATTFDGAITMMTRFAGAGGLRGSIGLGAREMAMVMGVLGVLLVGGWIYRDRRVESVAARLPAPVLAMALAALLGATWLLGGPIRAFIYFQF